MPRPWHQDVAFGPHNLGLSQAEVVRRVESSLARVGLDLATVGGKSPFELSGGQQRRVAFAGVLAMEPRSWYSMSHGGARSGGAQ